MNQEDSDPRRQTHEKALHSGDDGHEALPERPAKASEHREDPRHRRSHITRASPLSAEEEDIMHKVIGAAIEVHRALGPGFLESIYQKSMQIELSARQLQFEAERVVEVEYRGVRIPGQRIDLIVEKRIVVELKAVVRFERVHTGQVISYLETLGLRGGLLINFRVPLLMRGIKRIVV